MHYIKLYTLRPDVYAVGIGRFQSLSVWLGTVSTPAAFGAKEKFVLFSVHAEFKIFLNLPNKIYWD